jgi:AraC-like DNA-binding protein
MKANLEKIPPNPARGYLFFHNEGQRFHVPYHFHPEVEITQIVRGTGYRLVGDSREEFGVDDLVLLGANLPHAYFSYELPHDATDSLPSVSARVLQFGIAPIFALVEQFPEARAFRQLLDDSRTGIAYHGQSARRAIAQMEGLEVAGGEAAGLVRFLALLETLVTAADHERKPLSSPAFWTRQPETFDYIDTINAACDYIHQHFRDDLTQGEIAQRVGLSASAFSRLFNRATGRSFRQYLNEIRVGHACRMMIETHTPITVIASECGYGNQSNFNRRFRELKQVSPRAFRRLF